jgi:hypothetical protein
MLRRGMMIKLAHVTDNQFDIMDMSGNVQVKCDDDYFIYMRDVKFIDGDIVGVYLGTASDALIDDYCLDIDFFGGGFYIELDKIESARMIIVDSANKKIIKVQ